MEIKQKIHDALLMELVKQDEKGKYPNLMNLVKRGNFVVKCSVDVAQKGCVDLVLEYPKSMSAGETKDGGFFIGVSGQKDTAFELITDVDFDAGKKLEQVNRYKKGFKDVRVIIPEDYKEYLQLFAINGVTVHFWKGTRRWKGKCCGHITEVKDSSMQPETCGFCQKRELFFVGFKNDVVFK